MDEWRVKIESPVGGGVLVAGGFVLTVAPAAPDGVGRTGAPPHEPLDRVPVRVDVGGVSTRQLATVEHRSPPAPESADVGDLVVLRLPEPPAGVAGAPVARFRPGVDESGQAFGYPGGTDGVREHFRIGDTTEGARGPVQLDPENSGSALAGFTGAGVVGDRTGAVIGLVALGGDGGRRAWMVTMDTLAAAWPPLAAVLDDADPTIEKALRAARGIPAIADPATRALVVADLPADITDAIEPGPDGEVSVERLVEACVRRPGGLAALAEVVRRLDGDSPEVRALTDVVSGVDPPVGPPDLGSRTAVTRPAGADDGVRRRIGTTGFGDRPAERDALSRAALVGTLVDLIDHHPAADEPVDGGGATVIAVEGSWGTGKSSLIEMVRRRLAETAPPEPRLTWWQRRRLGWRTRRLRACDADLALGGWPIVRRVAARIGRLLPTPPVPVTPRLVTVMFNPWSYQTGEQIWAGLTDAVVRALEPAFSPAAATSERARERHWFSRNIRQLDRRRLQKTLRSRVLSPVLRVAVFALPAPILAQVVRATDPLSIGPWSVAPVDATLCVVGALLGLGLLHTAVRYVVEPAAVLLPGDLFVRPVATGATAAQTTESSGAVIHDPYYRARAGYLYLAQHDVLNVLETMQDAGIRLVVCVDDLDRCSPRITAEVFEAMNVFLSQSYPTVRFLLALDCSVVAMHLDAAYEQIGTSKSVTPNPGDPSWGWTFLRKLIQLPVLVPRITSAHVDPVLRQLLGEVSHPAAPHPDEGPPPPPRAAGGPADRPADQPDDRRAVATGAAAPDGAASAAVIRALERDPQVRERLDERLRAQPDPSVRETKRILTIWQFYVRLLGRLRSAPGSTVDDARRLVILAEIVARWPAWQRRLHQRIDGVHGLRLLSDALDDDTRWDSALAHLGLDRADAAGFVAALRELLTRYEDDAIADLAEALT